MRTIAEPICRDYDGGDSYSDYVSDIEKRIRVVVVDDRLLTAYIDRRQMKGPELVIQYFPYSDTLRLGAGLSPAEGETIAKWLMVECSEE